MEAASTKHFAVVYIDPEAKPSHDLVGLYHDRGMDIRWIADYREIDPRRNTQKFHAIVVDLTSQSPEDFRIRVQEARSIDLSLPSIAIAPPMTGDVMPGLVKDKTVSAWLERPIDQDELVNLTLERIQEHIAIDEADGTSSGSASSPLDEAALALDALVGGEVESKPSMVMSDLFRDILDDPEGGEDFLPRIKTDTRAKIRVAHEYHSMRSDVMIQDLPPGAEELQNYVLEEHVATGGMAELFKARLRGAEGFARTVAIKRILPVRVDDDDFVAMFIDEARLASSLDHPNIVRTLDFGKCKTASGQDTYFIALDFVEGKDLNWIIRRLRERGLCVPEQIITYIAAKIASALQYLHMRKFPNGDPMRLVHRDISPHNIMLSKQGGVVIVDFGVVKAASKINQTMDGNLKGKLVYMSPEQANGGELDGRSDLFSLGLVIHEALTMERAYVKGRSRGDHAVLKLAQSASIPPVRDGNSFVTKGIEEILCKATQKKPGHRYSDAAQMEKALKAHLRTFTERVEEQDIADFVMAILDNDPNVLKNLIQTKYPATMEWSAAHAMTRINAVAGGDAPEGEQRALDGKDSGRPSSEARSRSSSKTVRPGKTLVDLLTRVLLWGSVIAVGVLVMGYAILRAVILK